MFIRIAIVSLFLAIFSLQGCDAVQKADADLTSFLDWDSDKAEKHVVYWNERRTWCVGIDIDLESDTPSRSRFRNDKSRGLATLHLPSED